MAEAAYTDNANPMGRFHPVAVQRIEDGSASAHERCSASRVKCVRYLEKEGFFPYYVCRKGALVKIAGAVHVPVVAEVLLSRQTLFTAATRIVLVPPACSVPSTTRLIGFEVKNTMTYTLKTFTCFPTFWTTPTPS